MKEVAWATAVVWMDLGVSESKETEKKETMKLMTMKGKGKREFVWVRGFRQRRRGYAVISKDVPVVHQ